MDGTPLMLPWPPRDSPRKESRLVRDRYARLIAEEPLREIVKVVSRYAGNIRARDGKEPAETEEKLLDLI
jgi:hypothetical protein